MDEPRQNSTTSFWFFHNFKDHSWFKFLVITLISAFVLYLVLHLAVDIWCKQPVNYEYASLSEKQMQQINHIYFNDSGTVMTARNPATGMKDTFGPDTTKGHAKIQKDSTSATTASSVKKKEIPAVKFCPCADSTTCVRIIEYLQTEFNNKLDTQQINKFRHYLCTAKPLEATAFLATLRLEVKSYFWLTGPAVYFEIVFWSVFGVLSSLLYALGLVSRNSGLTAQDGSVIEFDPQEIPSQLAKLLYAPLCTLTIVLGYNFFKDQNIVDISSSKGVIVFSFIGGFYSSRLISFLDRLKEVLLPASGSSSIVPANKSAGDNSNKPNAPTNIKIIAELGLDPTVSPNIMTPITPADFSTAAVTGLLAGTTDTISFKPETPGSNSFTSPPLKPGNYLISATLTKTIGGQVVDLKGQQNISLSNIDVRIKINLK